MRCCRTTPNVSDRSSQFAAPGRLLLVVKGYGAPETGLRLCPRKGTVGAAGFPLGVPSCSLWTVFLPRDPRRIRDLALRLDEDLLRLSRQRDDSAGLFWVTYPPVET